MTLKGNYKTHCKHNHELSGDNLYISPKGSRGCVQCRKEYSKSHPKKYNVEQMRIHRAKWRERNPDYHKYHWLQRAYGITAEHYNEMIESRNNKCDICHEDMDRPCVDHDHSCCPNMHKTCGKCIRGLLCTRCNLALGRLKDSEILLESALQYLKEYKRCPR